MKYVDIEQRERIAIIRFDRSDGINAMSRSLMTELIDAAHAFDNEYETSAIVVYGSGGNFTLGLDLKDRENAEIEGMGLAEKRKALQLGPKLCRAFEELEPMTFMAIEGLCVGGGAALAVAGDLRVVGESAVFYVPEIERGMNMSWQSVPRFVRLVGPAKTKRIVVMAEKISAQTALEWGLADELTETGGALSKALELAEKVATLPPVQVRMCKQAISMAANALNHAVSFMDMDQFALAQSSEDCREGIMSFLEKRPPVYKGK
jgi:enoyl-CoA hydratase/carnithine racemase